MPVDSGVTVVTILVCLFLSHTHWASGIPCALCYLGANGFCKTSGASRCGIAEPYSKIVVVSAQACGLKQPQGGDMTADQFAAFLYQFPRSPQSATAAPLSSLF